MNKKFIIGLGTGRCGTTSLSVLLSAQNETVVPHEYKYPLPWQFSEKEISERLNDLRNLNGDVAFYYLNYIKYILEIQPETKFVCLQRGRQETVESYMRKSENRNNWMEHDETVWKKNKWFFSSYPKFNVNDKEEAIGLYYDLYYEIAEEFQKEIPGSFKIFDMQKLNEIEGVVEILSFCGFEYSEMNLETGICFNQTF